MAIIRMENALEEIGADSADITDVKRAMRKVGTPIAQAIRKLTDPELDAVAAVIVDVQDRMLDAVKRENS